MATVETVRSLNSGVNARSIPDLRLFRAGLLMLLFMTTAFGAAAWNTMQQLTILIKVVPVILFVVVCILVAHLYARVDELAVSQKAVVRPAEPGSAPQGNRETALVPQYIATLAQVPDETRAEIWNYWDRNGTGRQEIQRIRYAYGMPAIAVQHLLEQYDVRSREQLATLYSGNPRHEYASYAGLDMTQVAVDALRLKSGLPIYPVAGVWLCSTCRQRPCHCAPITQKDSSPLQ